MRKFGLPDVLINDSPCLGSETLGSFINLVCQTIVENGMIKRKGRLPVNIDSIKNEDLRTILSDSLKQDAAKKADLTIVKGEPEQGDPENKLIEIKFIDGSRTGSQVEQKRILSQIFGSEDEVHMVKESNVEILAASRRAKKKIPALKEKFVKGLSVAEHLLFKFPFTNKEGENEFMWVEVIEWSGDNIIGILQNDPVFVTDLKAGARVKKKIDQVFDYIFYLPDGKTEGNETGKIILKMQEK
jgi:uncharacterized protein YegJ (DUF2314 family)